MVTKGHMKYFKRVLIVKSKRPQKKKNPMPNDLQAELSDEAFAPVHSWLLYVQTA